MALHLALLTVVWWDEAFGTATDMPLCDYACCCGIALHVACCVVYTVTCLCAALGGAAHPNVHSALAHVAAALSAQQQPSFPSPVRPPPPLPMYMMGQPRFPM